MDIGTHLCQVLEEFDMIEAIMNNNYQPVIDPIKEERRKIREAIGRARDDIHEAVSLHL